jgi:glycine dehydrogenase subunit 2
MHECVVSATTPQAHQGRQGVDVAKRLLEEGFHSPTVYFPLIVDEALMIEPTETESPQTVAAIADALVRIAEGASPDDAQAPRVNAVRRVDEARAARQLIPTFDARPPAGAADPAAV